MESAKECVTTHLPNELALKMDGAKASHSYLAVTARTKQSQVGGCRGCCAARPVRGSETALGTDLGGSSKYSNENFED